MFTRGEAPPCEGRPPHLSRPLGTPITRILAARCGRSCSSSRSAEAATASRPQRAQRSWGVAAPLSGAEGAGGAARPPELRRPSVRRPSSSRAGTRMGGFTAHSQHCDPTRSKVKPTQGVTGNRCLRSEDGHGRRDEPSEAEKGLPGARELRAEAPDIMVGTGRGDPKSIALHLHRKCPKRCRSLRRGLQSTCRCHRFVLAPLRCAPVYTQVDKSKSTKTYPRLTDL